MRLTVAPDPAPAIRVLREAVALGVNHIDTAAFYVSPGGTLGVGEGAKRYANRADPRRAAAVPAGPADRHQGRPGRAGLGAQRRPSCAPRSRRTCAGSAATTSTWSTCGSARARARQLRRGVRRPGRAARAGSDPGTWGCPRRRPRTSTRPARSPRWPACRTLGAGLPARAGRAGARLRRARHRLRAVLHPGRGGREQGAGGGDPRGGAGGRRTAPGASPQQVRLAWALHQGTACTGAWYMPRSTGARRATLRETAISRTWPRRACGLGPPQRGDASSRRSRASWRSALRARRT
ncbi:hypothetical protein [Actinoplanes nipponensis]|uniref:hypothetical protein n=1 Tax=Actinoplanes nipponensis TaxID=135950 RepID=UPI0031E6C665